MIVLASQSEARNRLLKAAGVPCVSVAHRIDEEQMPREANPSHLASNLAEAKARSLLSSYAKATIIGSDQTLSCEGQILSKPGSIAELRCQLAFLRGKTHDLHSAVTVLSNHHIPFNHVSTARLTMRSFSEAFLETYVNAAPPTLLHCVGGYQIEDTGLQLFQHIEGDLFTIQGLPLLPLLAHLREIGAIPS